MRVDGKKAQPTKVIQTNLFFAGLNQMRFAR